MRRTLLALGVLAVVGCSPADPETPDPPELRLREVSRLGTIGGVGSALTSVADVAVTDSTVLVLESSPPRAAVFGLDGKWIRDVGRSGDGPGELRRPSRIGRSNGSIWIGDPAGGRLEVFSPDGRPLVSHRWVIPPDSLGARMVPSALLDDGSILAGPPLLSLGAASRGLLTHRAYVRADASGNVLSEIYREELVPSDFFVAEVGSAGMIIGVHPVRESPLVAVFPDGSGLAVVERLASRDGAESSFRIKVFSSGGALETDVRVPYVPVSSDGWLDGYLSEREAEMMEESGTVNRGMIDALRGALVDRPFYPPVVRLLAGADGTIWVQREEVSPDSVRWQVFSRSGRRLGGLAVSSSVRLQLVSLESIWATERDALDVPFVIEFEVVR